MPEPKKKLVKKTKPVAEVVPIEEEPRVEKPKVEAIEDIKPSAKAGKRSPKATKEAEEKQVKEERKRSVAKTGEKPKLVKKPTRSKSERAGKKYKEAYQKIEKDKTYTLTEALELAIQTSPTKFDSSVEVHLNLNVDPKLADQNVRGTVALPAGTGKSLKVAVIADEADARKAKAAGAEFTDAQELLDKLSNDVVDFDILVSTPAFMVQLGKFAKFLGPRGLMPNPKSGTVTSDVAKAVQEAKAGKIEYRVDSQSIIHISIGKISFGSEKLRQNAEAALESIRSAKPPSVKGTFIKSVYVTTTMGPSIKTEV